MTQIILKESNSSQTISLDKDVASIGRSSKNDVVLREGGVSRFHAQIRKTSDGYIIVDLDSRNGIYFQGNRVKERKLEVGDEIEIGDAIIVFEKELPKVEEKTPPVSDSTSPILSLSADEFISTPRKNIAALLIRIIIIISIVGVLAGYGYIKIQERTNRKINLISGGASFEQFSLPAMFPSGWQPTSDSTARIVITDKEHQDGQYSLLIEKNIDSSEFYTEFAHNSVIRIPSRVRANINEIYDFGGWIKSDPLKKSLAGYKVSWFNAEHHLIREDYTDFTSNANEWRYCSKSTRPPLDAEYGRFFCIVLGTGAKVYFDNAILFQTRAEEILPQIIKDKLIVSNQSFNLTIAPSGIWTLQDIHRSLRLEGELVFKANNIESRQSFYSRGKIINYTQNENLEITGQIVHPVSLEMINIPIEASISPTFGVNYTFPASLYASLPAKPFSLVVSFPIGDIRYLRLINAAGVQEKSLYEKISEKMITEINLGLANNIISLKYSQPIDLVVTRDADILYFTQTIQPLTLMEIPSPQTEQMLNFRVEFALKSIIQDQTDWGKILKRAEELEKDNNLGEAIELYRSVILEADKKSDVTLLAQDRLSIVENHAKEMVQNNLDLLSTARLTRDFYLYEKVLKTSQEIIKIYKKSEYAEQSKDIVQQIKTEIQQIKSSDDKQNAGKMLLIADGYLKEKQLNLALLLYQQIIQKYGETASAQQAKENMDKIKKETPVPDIIPENPK